jgi:hypothetical protein
LWEEVFLTMFSFAWSWAGAGSPRCHDQKRRIQNVFAIIKRKFQENPKFYYAKQLGMRAEEVFRLTDFTREDFLNMMTRDTNGYSKAQIIRKV